MTAPMLRISGKIEFISDKKLKEKVILERPFLKNFGFTADSPGLYNFQNSTWSGAFLDNGNEFET
jgi:uncharacterized pyridoxamine 5'-phosphate oxidase family protein